VVGIPEQLFENGVMVMNEVTGTFDPLTPVKDPTVAVPDNGIRPVTAVELVQLYTVLFMAEPEKVTCVVATPLQIAWSGIALTAGIGFTVMEKFLAVPEQVFDIGVTVRKEVTGTLVALVAVNELIVPVPDNGINPVAEFVFVQL
jgi:hypothetical protein